MKLGEYFDRARGTGVLATSDASGTVNVALYSRPHFPDERDDKTVAFIMADRLSHANLRENPNGAFMFIEEGQGYAGCRLRLTKVREETGNEVVAAICHRCNYNMYGKEALRHVVFFTVDEVLPLIGPSPG